MLQRPNSKVGEPLNHGFDSMADLPLVPSHVPSQANAHSKIPEVPNLQAFSFKIADNQNIGQAINPGSNNGLCSPQWNASGADNLGD